MLQSPAAMDYEKPYIPASWDEFAKEWAEKLGLGDKEIKLICATERFGAPVILRLVGKGPKIVYTRRSSDAHDAAARRTKFIDAATNKAFDAVEIDMAGFFVEEALVAPKGSPAHPQGQPATSPQLPPAAGPTPKRAAEGEDADPPAAPRRAPTAQARP